VALLLDPGLTTSAEYGAFARLRRDTPTPRVREGELIGAAHSANAMIDISDGLAGDLGHICESSSVGVRLFAQSLPVSKANRALSQAVYDGDEWHFALHGGENYELLFTVPAAQAEALAEQVTSATGTPVTIIGEIVPLAQGQRLALENGSSIPIQPRGWDHFKENK
jgi:thiamine-monophosphate kinase